MVSRVKYHILTVGVAVSVFCTPAIAKDVRFESTWESLRQHNEAPVWFRDAKFGIYFHWGVYAVPAFGSEWYPRNMHVKNRPEYKHHIEKSSVHMKRITADTIPAMHMRY